MPHPNLLIDPVTYPVIETVTTYSGTLSTGEATSTPLISANVTMAPNSDVCPTVFNKLTVVNIGTNVAFISWFGGTAGTSTGCLSLAGGASVTVNLGGKMVPPSFYSTAGTTLAFYN